MKPELSLEQSPIVMIAPGTGIAPFVAFLERFRDEQKQRGVAPAVKRYLFYGSSNFEKEFICRWASALLFPTSAPF